MGTSLFVVFLLYFGVGGAIWITRIDRCFRDRIFLPWQRAIEAEDFEACADFKSRADASQARLRGAVTLFLWPLHWNDVR